jgi:L-ribulokinase
VFEPDAWSVAVYNEVFPLYRKLYFGLGSRDAPAVAIGDVLPALRDVAERVRRAS